MVLADGCFDPLHVGHLDYFLACRKQGGRLIVHVAPDDAILAKGRRPFQTREERERVIASLRSVDWISDVPTLVEAIRAYKPNYLVKGIDWKDRLPAEVVEACKQTGTEMIFVNTQSRSSSARLAS